MRIYTYGALPPTEGAEIVREQLRAANHYYNRLVEIERARRKAYREIESTVVSDETRARRDAAETAEEETAAWLAKAKADGDAAEEKTQSVALKAARQATKDARAAYKAEAEPLRVAALFVGAARDVEKASREEAQERDRDDDLIASLLLDLPALAPQWEALVRAPDGTLVSSRKKRPTTKKALSVQATEKRRHVLDSTGALLRAAPAAEQALAQRLLASESECAALARKARGESNVPWGTYLLVEAAVKQAAGASPGDPDAPRFHRFDGGGRIGAPIATEGGGLALDDIADGTRFRLAVLPLPEGATSKTIQKRRHALASIRVGSDDNDDPIWATWPVLLHRPLPEGGRVKCAWALKRKVGSTERWEIQITVDDAPVKRQRGAQEPRPEPSDVEGSAAPTAAIPAGPRVVAVDLGWRRSSGYRVGYIVDLDGRREAVCAPPVSFVEGRRRREQWAKAGRKTAPAAEALIKNGWRLPMLEALAYLAGIRAVRDKHFDVAIGFVREYLAREGRENLPDWLREATSAIHQWKGHGRLVGLLRQWATAEHWRPEDEAILDGIRLWAQKDQHLWDWEAHGRERILRARREHYRVEASKLVARYDTILLPDVDLRTFARAPAPEDGDPSDGRPLRISQKMCAPSEWKEAILNAAKREGRVVITLKPVDDSRTCHVCGSVETIGADLFHACLKCGAIWDRDANACVNRLRKAGYDPARALRCCVSSQDRSQGSSPTDDSEAESA